MRVQSCCRDSRANAVDQELSTDLSQYPHVEETIVFGSRAKGNHKPGSDIDIAIKGSALTREDICSLAGAFEESLLPFFVDLLAYSSISNPELKAHIDRVGITIYKQ